MAMDYSMHGEVREVRKPEVKKTLERPQYRWKNNIKIDLKKRAVRV
jgi:hypothetical protein